MARGENMWEEGGKFLAMVCRVLWQRIKLFRKKTSSEARGGKSERWFKFYFCDGEILVYRGRRKLFDPKRAVFSSTSVLEWYKVCYLFDLIKYASEQWFEQMKVKSKVLGKESVTFQVEAELSRYIVEVVTPFQFPCRSFNKDGYPLIILKIY